MDAEKIRELRLAYPFKPFKLVMQDGREIPVKSAFSLGIAPEGRAVLVIREDGRPVSFPPSHVKDVVMIETANRAAAGGA